MYKEGLDYTFIPIEDSDLFAIRILQGNYKNVVFCYGGVGVSEEGEGARLKFDYVIIDSATFTVEDLTEDANFSTMLGDILIDIITVERQNDSPGNNHPQESDPL